MRGPDAAIARALVAFSLLFCLGGCVLGPGSLLHSRTNYNRAVQKTAREELLLNLVRMRYGQSVEFMSVPSITGQHTYDAALGGSGSWRETIPTVLGASLGLGAQSKPTIVYTPEQGQVFNRRLLSPFSSQTLDLVASKGWSIERVLRLTVRNINDVDNATPAGGPTPRYKPDYEEFQILSRLFRQLQVNDQRPFEVAIQEDETKPPKQLHDAFPIGQIDGDALVAAAEKGYRFRVSGDMSTATLWRNKIEENFEVLRFSSDVNHSHELMEIRRILELDPKLTEYRIRTDVQGQLKRPHSRRFVHEGELPEPREDLIVSTRSLKEVMYYLSHVVEVPDSHVRQGYVQQTLDEIGCPFDWKNVVGDLFQVHYSRFCPKHAAVAVKYRGRWFYIDDADISSKETFNLLFELFNLELRAGGGAQIPLLAI